MISLSKWATTIPRRTGWFQIEAVVEALSESVQQSRDGLTETFSLQVATTWLGHTEEIVAAPYRQVLP